MVSDINANDFYNNFHEVVDISQLPPKIISARCYCVPSLTQYYSGLDQVQSEGKACPYMPYTCPSLQLQDALR